MDLLKSYICVATFLAFVIVQEGRVGSDLKKAGGGEDRGGEEERRGGGKVEKGGEGETKGAGG